MRVGGDDWHSCDLSGLSSVLRLSVLKFKHHLGDLAGEVSVLMGAWQIMRSISVEW